MSSAKNENKAQHVSSAA